MNAIRPRPSFGLRMTLGLLAALSLAMPRGFAGDLEDLSSSARSLGDEIGASKLALQLSHATPAERIDLSGQFPTPADRSQGPVGSCHAFVATALLEAAIYRNTGRHVKLSEADLFLQNALLNPGLFGELLKGKYSLKEAVFPENDVRFAVRNGIATDDFYNDLLRRYLPWRCSVNGQLQDLKKAEALYRAKRAADPSLPDPVKVCYDQATSSDAKRLKEGLFAADHLEGLEAQRAQVRELLRGFSVSGPKYFSNSLHVCRDKTGRLQREQAILAELRRGRPVYAYVRQNQSGNGTGMWGPSKSGVHRGFHAIIITGYQDGPDGPSFLIRNSWGGQNPSIPESALCQVAGIMTVLTPSETARH